MLCWGTNEIGAQTEPCGFTIVPSGNVSITMPYFVNFRYFTDTVWLTASVTANGPKLMNHQIIQRLNLLIGKPDPVTNCTVFNQTHDGFQIDCVEGFDGGLPQQFILEAYTMGQKTNPIILKSR